MPFGVTLDFSTSTCWQSSGSFSVDWSSETHSIRMRISFQGTLPCICFKLIMRLIATDLSHRLIFFTTFVIYGFVPTIHWALLNGIGSDEVDLRFLNSHLLILHIQTRLFLPRVLIMYLLAGLAFVFYIAKFPEVVLPGRYITPSFLRPFINWSYLRAADLFVIHYSLFLRFDILGSSHQWWHIFIFLCLAYCKLLPWILHINMLFLLLS